VSTYALLDEDGGLALIFDIKQLLAAIGRVGDVQLREVVSISGIILVSRGSPSDPRRGKSQSSTRLLDKEEFSLLTSSIDDLFESDGNVGFHAHLHRAGVWWCKLA
jgi:hypothetical protein